MGKRSFGRELWRRMRDFAASADGLSELECGPWTIEKLYFLCSYLAQTTQAMVGNPRFSSVNYVDLFASNGICTVTEAGHRQRYPGSALLAAGCTKPFDHLFLVERDSKALHDLRQRLARLRCASQVHGWPADANGVIAQLADAIPDRSLTVAFVDPFSLDVHFETIRTLAYRRPLDLLILFADDIDLVRNVEKYYYPRTDSKLDEFLGGESDWRREWERLHVRDAEHVRELFANIYRRQLEGIGYMYSDTVAIPRRGRSMYRLIYASKHDLGLKFWRIARGEELGGDRTLFREP